MQNIPVDVGRLGTLMVVVPPEPRVVPDTGEICKDRDGNQIYVTGVSVRQAGSRRADVIEVATPGEPTGLAEGVRVHVADLVAVSWEIDGRKGTSFRASGIAAAAPVAAPASSARSRTAAGGDPRES
ncbi:hypothetical protein [Streptomyces sp. NPDC059479]|uniref:SCO3933 family regulatory protein n=1 Tax=Streptomyces sp. NPDC059479 TaxID=3346848 RepID=UPI0036962AA1